MKLPGSPADSAILSTLLFPMLAAAVGIDCTKVVVDGAHFKLKELGGPRSVVHRVDEGPSYTNTTYTIDICRPLGKAKHVNPDDQCPNGTRLCAIQHQISENGDNDILRNVYPIAGELLGVGGRSMDAKWELLKNSKSNEDSTKEGLRLEMNGGFKETDTEKKRPQKAIVEFICDRARTGLEHLPTPRDPYDEVKDKRAEENGGDEGEGDDGTPSLEFVRYDTDGKDADILRLRWRTKYACETPVRWPNTGACLPGSSSLRSCQQRHTSSSARGSTTTGTAHVAWDLLPHGDTIRDIPYLLKDWFRRVLNTVQGGGSRGGYAAV